MNARLAPSAPGRCLMKPMREVGYQRIAGSLIGGRIPQAATN